MAKLHVESVGGRLGLRARGTVDHRTRLVTAHMIRVIKNLRVALVTPLLLYVNVCPTNACGPEFLKNFRYRHVQAARTVVKLAEVGLCERVQVSEGLHVQCRCERFVPVP